MIWFLKELRFFEKVFWIEFAFNSFETAVEKVQTNDIILCLFTLYLTQFILKHTHQYKFEQKTEIKSKALEVKGAKDPHLRLPLHLTNTYPSDLYEFKWH